MILISGTGAGKRIYGIDGLSVWISERRGREGQELGALMVGAFLAVSPALPGWSVVVYDGPRQTCCDLLDNLIAAIDAGDLTWTVEDHL